MADVVREAFLAINRGDEETFLALLADDIEWISAAAGIVPPDVWRGRDAVREGRRLAREEGRHVHTTLQEIRTEDERALVFGIVTSELERRGHVTLPMAWVWRVDDGIVTSVESFTSRGAALKHWGEAN